MPQPPPAPSLPPRPTRQGDFEFFLETKDYRGAMDHCTGLGQGVHLATIDTKAENDLVLSLCEPNECWIGFNDMRQEGTWEWVDGTPASPAQFPRNVYPWNLGEPNGNGSDHADGAYVYPTSNIWVVPGSWDDDDTAKERSFVCRYGAAMRPPPPSPPPPRPADSPPFHFHGEKLAYEAAEQACVAEGKHLAAIHTMDENEQVLALCFDQDCWIGYNDQEQESTWAFTDGSAANFSSFPGGVAPWNPGEPNGKADEATDGAYMYTTTSNWVRAGTWDDDDITHLKPYVCRDVPSPPPSPPPPQPPPTPPSPLPPPPPPSPPPPPPSPPPPSPPSSPPPRPLTLGPFHFRGEKLAYEAAEQACVSEGKHLASIHTPEENEQVLLVCGRDAQCWIGYNDIVNETVWVFTDGSAANFSDFAAGVAPWNPGEPNGKGHEKTDGAYMYTSSNGWVTEGKWDDTDISEKKEFVCRDPPPSPPAASAGMPLADSGGGGGGAVVFWLLFLASLAGCGYCARTRHLAGKPIVPTEVWAILPTRRAPPHAVQFDRETPRMAPEYTPPVAPAVSGIPLENPTVQE